MDRDIENVTRCLEKSEPEDSKKHVTYRVPLKTGINRSIEFEKKLLATYTVNVGLRCSNSCLYCSSPALMRCHPGFKSIGRNPYESGYSVIDPETPRRVARDIHKIGVKDTLMLCSATDAWSADARYFNIGRQCLEIPLKQSNSKIRALTKNAEIANDYDLMEQYRERVMVSLSITAPVEKQPIMSIIEPRASSIEQRVESLVEAHKRGLKTYGMLCPCIPGISDNKDALSRMFGHIMPAEPEDIWLEPLNSRGPGVKRTAEALRNAGFKFEAESVDSVRSNSGWNAYVVKLIKIAQRVASDFSVMDRLHILLYPKRLSSDSVAELQKDARCIIWL